MLTCQDSLRLMFLLFRHFFIRILCQTLNFPSVLCCPLCLCSYRTYMRPRYKVAYKMVTEMEWKCCHGYSGEDCANGPADGAVSQISTTRPQPGHEGGTSYGQGGGHNGEWITFNTNPSEGQNWFELKGHTLKTSVCPSCTQIVSRTRTRDWSQVAILSSLICSVWLINEFSQ